MKRATHAGRFFVVRRTLYTRGRRARVEKGRVILANGDPYAEDADQWVTVLVRGGLHQIRAADLESIESASRRPRRGTRT